MAGWRESKGREAAEQGVTDLLISTDARDGPDRLVEMHAAYYGRVWGFGEYFRDKVAADLQEFRDATPSLDCRLWFARRDGETIGSIAIDGRAAAEKGAHLRWFILDDGARGAGAGARLIDTALDFCRARNFASVHLWTFAGLDGARKLYERRGFRLAEEFDAQTWGVRVREQRFVLTLAP